MTEVSKHDERCVLVAFASKHGSTEEIAAAIGHEISAHGLAVDVVEAGDVHDLSPYTDVVAGSAVYLKRWRPSARRLMRRLQRDLGDRPLWIFSSGFVGDSEPDPVWCEPAAMLKQARQLNLQDHVVFGGRVPQAPRNFVERAMLKSTPADQQDRRDFVEIRRWAAAIASSTPASAVAPEHPEPVVTAS